MSESICDELNGINLGDKRLDKRAKTILEDFAVNPEASINAACNGWSDTAAAYRFFDNQRVTLTELLRAHREATLHRMRDHSVVLLVKDATELELTRRPPKDAQCLNTTDRFGLYAHAHLAVTPSKLNLGVSEFERRRLRLSRPGAGNAWTVRPAGSVAH